MKLLATFKHSYSYTTLHRMQLFETQDFWFVLSENSSATGFYISGSATTDVQVQLTTGTNIANVQIYDT